MNEKEIELLNEIKKSNAEKSVIFKDKEETQEVSKVVDEKNELISDLFKEGIKHQVKNNEELQNKVLETAKTYTETKMQVIQTEVDTEHKEAVFNNCKDACESYGFNEKTTPIWATKIMTVGYSIMLAIWLIIGTFTFMPVIFVAKKLQVGLKKTWLAIIFAVLLYLGITLIPLLIALISKG